MIGPEWVAENATNVRFPQGPNQWRGRSKDVMIECFRDMQALSKALSRLVAEGLGLEEYNFDGFIGSEDYGCPFVLSGDPRTITLIAAEIKRLRCVW